jgi:hypothetical protein
MTWLDWHVHQCANAVRAEFRAKGVKMTRTSDGSPNIVAAFGTLLTLNILEYSADPEAHARCTGGATNAYESVLLSGCVLPFLQGFIPASDRVEKLVSGPGLGLILSRETADMLANAAPPAADPWRQRIFGTKPEGAALGAVYVDIPHGALRLGNSLELRALFATPWRALADEADPNSKVIQTGAVLLAAVITALGSEHPKGLLLAVVGEDDRVRIVERPNHRLAGFLAADAEELGEASHANAMELYNLFYERTVDFFRLVLAYHHYGPMEGRGKVGVTSPAKFVRNGNRPRAGESIFAMVRLAAPASRLGRTPQAGINAGWVLTVHQDVAGHFKLQAHGPGLTQRRLIWIESYSRGPEDAPSKPRAVRV